VTSQPFQLPRILFVSRLRLVKCRHIYAPASRAPPTTSSSSHPDTANEDNPSAGESQHCSFFMVEVLSRSHDSTVASAVEVLAVGASYLGGRRACINTTASKCVGFARCKRPSHRVVSFEPFTTTKSWSRARRDTGTWTRVPHSC
jgi:hypothetical protein